MREVILLTAALALVGCAPAAWDRPDTTPEQFSMDRAQCQLMAEGANPDPGTTVIETGKLGTDIAANAGAGIAEGIVQGAKIGHTFNLCMQARGYMPISRQVVAAANGIKPIFADMNSCALAAWATPDGVVIAAKSPADPRDFTAAQLSDPVLPTESEAQAMRTLYPRLQACQRSALASLAASGAAPVASVLSNAAAQSQVDAALIEERKIEWGAFNTVRKEHAARLKEELVAAVKGLS